MKYLMSERLLAEGAEKFMREHEGCEFGMSVRYGVCR